MEQTLFTDSTGQDLVLNLRFHRESRIRYRADNLEAVSYTHLTLPTSDLV